MSNAKTGLVSAIGALLGGALGAAAGKYAVEARPRYRYAEQRPMRRGPGGTEVEDAMVVGAASGAVLGAFIGGTVAGEDPPPQLPPNR